jgi:hypothetical protein
MYQGYDKDDDITLNNDDVDCNEDELLEMLCTSDDVYRAEMKRECKITCVLHKVSKYIHNSKTS